MYHFIAVISYLIIILKVFQYALFLMKISKLLIKCFNEKQI